MTAFYWAGGTADIGAAASWLILGTHGTPQPATVAPGSSDALDVDTGGLLLGSAAVATFEINAAIAIAASTTVGSSTLIGTTAAGSVTVTGGTWTDTGLLIVADSADGALTIDAGGVVNDAGAMAVGDVGGGAGSVRIAAGGTLTTQGYQAVSEAVGGSGAVTVDGTGAVWQSSGPISVGDVGSGALTIANGATVATTGAEADDSGNLFIGTAPGANGLVTVASGGVLNTGPANLVVGIGGTGTLLVQGGTVLTSSAAYATLVGALVVGATYTPISGSVVDGTGIVTVDGADSVIQSDGPIWVASGGSALTIENAGTVEMTMAAAALGGTDGVAIGAFGTGAVTVTGAGSLLDAGAGGISVDAGGQLVVSDGGAVTTAASLTLDAGADLSVASGASIGIAGSLGGTGTLTVGAGGTISVAGSFSAAIGGAGGDMLTIGGGGVTITAPAVPAVASLTPANVMTADHVAFVTPAVLASASSGASATQDWPALAVPTATEMGFPTVPDAAAATDALAGSTPADAFGLGGAAAAVHLAAFGAAGHGDTAMLWHT